MMCWGGLCRWEFLAAQQLVFIDSILDLQLPGVARDDVQFVSATLDEPESSGRRLQEGMHGAKPLRWQSRLLQQSSDDGPLQSVNAIFKIQTASAAVTNSVATQLYTATANGSLTVSHLRVILWFTDTDYQWHALQVAHTAHAHNLHCTIEACRVCKPKCHTTLTTDSVCTCGVEKCWACHNPTGRHTDSQPPGPNAQCTF